MLTDLILFKQLYTILNIQHIIVWFSCQQALLFLQEYQPTFPLGNHLFLPVSPVTWMGMVLTPSLAWTYGLDLTVMIESVTDT